jgi:hypothetical protein
MPLDLVDDLLPGRTRRIAPLRIEQVSSRVYDTWLRLLG